MKVRVPNYFKDFKCIASKCEDTCCAGWGIVIDDETYKKYMNVNCDFGNKLRSKIVTDGSENIFVLKGNDCPFLDDNKLCEIYSELGEEYLCYTCKQYPRYTEEFGNLREVGISLSCPEGARIILRDSNKVTFELSENDDEISSYNDINATLFMNLLQCRKVVFDIIQNRSLELSIRLGIVLSLVDEIQTKIDNNEISSIKDVRDKYSEEEYILKIINKLDNYRNNIDIKYNGIYKYLNVFKELKHITPNDPLGLEGPLRYFWQSDEDMKVYELSYNRFNSFYANKEYEFENILVYYIFRYFMKAVFDYDVLAKIKIAIVSYLIIKELSVVRFIEEDNFKNEDMVDIAHMYSKDIEHLEENIEALSEIFETNKSFNIDNLLYIIMN